MKDRQPALDAEKVGRDQLLTNFRHPPGIGATLSRSALVVGTRGSGKTMFLRTLRHNHSGLAIYGDLRKILNPITADTGAAGLTFDAIMPSLEQPIQAKAMSLLSLWLGTQCAERGIAPSIPLLRRVLPKVLRNHSPSDISILEWLADTLYSSDLSSYLRSADLSAFLEFICDLAEKSQQSDGQLLILLDRAEEVPYPCLAPILSLLDQNHPFFTAIAARPGILGPNSITSPGLPTPGDHYDVRHLGFSPYSDEWRRFQEAVLGAWIPNATKNIPGDHLELLIRLSRDSVRCALELVHNSVTDGGEFDPIRSENAANNLQTMLLHAAQGQLRRLNEDLLSLLRKIRRSIKPFKLPLLLTLQNKDLFAYLSTARPFVNTSRDEQFVRLGLRVGLLTTKHGVAWYPDAMLDAVELHPLYIWKAGDKWYNTQHTI